MVRLLAALLLVSAMQSAAPTAPAARSGHALVDAGEQGGLLLFGGDHAWSGGGELWSRGADGWRMVDGSGPPPRTLAAVAFDAARGELVIEGGSSTDGTIQGDTWIRAREAGKDAKTRWRRVAAEGGPGVRDHHAMAFDAVHERIVLFGGQRAPGENLGDTWTWDGAAWRQLAIAGPSARIHHAMAWDASLEKVVLFGGSDGRADLADTWEFDGESWRKSDASGPSPRTGARVAWHEAGGGLLLFGGFAARGVVADLWRYDGSAWREVATKKAPPARSHHALAVDPASGRLVLFGGGDGMANLADTWEFDGKEWSETKEAAGSAKR